MNLSSTDLPEPDVDSQLRSQVLSELIQAYCTDQGGSIAFSEYMRLALYTPALGYYSGGLQKFGTQGDFITAPEISPLFSRCIARQCAQLLSGIVQADILEFGAGSGIMAADILLELEQLDALPVHYYIVELSAELQQRQRATIELAAPQLLDRVSWLQVLPDTLSGVILANEVLDAMPVECFRKTRAGVERLQVTGDNGNLQLGYQNAPAEVTQAVSIIEERRGAALPEAYCSEFNPSIPGWIQAIADRLETGLVLLIDYGYPVSEYYHEQRDAGTLICHYQHRAHADPLRYPGLQDITAFVDFSAVAYAAEAAKLAVSGYTTQADFLIACGLQELYQSLLTDDAKQQILLSQQIKTLTLPSEMGERFKVMALTKNIEADLCGFSMQDYRNRL